MWIKASIFKRGRNVFHRVINSKRIKSTFEGEVANIWRRKRGKS